MNKNLNLWSELERTDQDYTKEFTRGGGFKGTQIDPVWRMRRMTEVFGPVGKGWGYEELKHVITDGMVFVQLRVWYTLDGEKLYTGPQYGGTELFNRRSGGLVPNDEAFKMSVTDALGRCFLQIGLSADVYLGLFDDNKYKEETAKIKAKDNPDLSDEAIAEFQSKIFERIEAVTDPATLDTIWKDEVNAKIKEIKKVNKEVADRIIGFFSAKKAKLAPTKDDKKETKKESVAPEVAAARARFKEVVTAIGTASAEVLPILYAESQKILEEIAKTSPEGKETLVRKFEERAKELNIVLGESNNDKRLRLMREVARLQGLVDGAKSHAEINKITADNTAILNEISVQMPKVYETVGKSFNTKIMNLHQ